MLSVENPTVSDETQITEDQDGVHVSVPPFEYDLTSTAAGICLLSGLFVSPFGIAYLLYDFDLLTISGLTLGPVLVGAGVGVRQRFPSFFGDARRSIDGLLAVVSALTGVFWLFILAINGLADEGILFLIPSIALAACAHASARRLSDPVHAVRLTLHHLTLTTEYGEQRYAIKLLDWVKQGDRHIVLGLKHREPIRFGEQFSDAAQSLLEQRIQETLDRPQPPIVVPTSSRARRELQALLNRPDTSE